MNDHPVTKYTPLSAVLPRLYWMLFGSIVLLFISITTASGSFENIYVASVVFWLNAVCMVIVRYVDIRFFHGETVNFQTATMADWRKYSVFLLIACAFVWALALFLRGLYMT